VNTLEIIAVVFGVVAIWLASKGEVVNFGIGLVNCVLYGILFGREGLYSGMILQGIYFVINLYGLYSWRKPKVEVDKELKVMWLTAKERVCVLLIVVTTGVLWGMGVKWGAQLLPENIQEPQYPMVDAILTTASVVAQILLTRKKIDNWVIWVLVDVIYIGLFLMVGMYWTAGLYVVYVLIAIRAIREWNKEEGTRNRE
jgi:nicotinamide mononucleotide transporter